jgi:hypothetical protein
MPELGFPPDPSPLKRKTHTHNPARLLPYSERGLRLLVIPHRTKGRRSVESRPDNSSEDAISALDSEVLALDCRRHPEGGRTFRRHPVEVPDDTSVVPEEDRVPHPGAEGDTRFSPIRPLRIDPIDEGYNRPTRGKGMPEGPAKEVGIEISCSDFQERIGTGILEPNGYEVHT